MCCFCSYKERSALQSIIMTFLCETHTANRTTAGRPIKWTILFLFLTLILHLIESIDLTLTATQPTQ